MSSLFLGAKRRQNMLSRLRIVDGRKLSGSGIHLNQKLSEFAPSMPHAVGSDIINKHSQQVTKPTPAWTSLPDTPPPAYYAPESPFA